MTGFGGFDIEPLYYYLYIGVWTFRLSLSHECSALLITGALTLTLITIGDTGQLHFTYNIRCHSLPQDQPVPSKFVPPGADNTYDLGVFSPAIDVIVSGCARLIFDIFFNHSDCW